MNYYIIRYWAGFHNRSALVIADSADEAQSMFLTSQAHLRRYNVISVRETSGRIYQLAG